MCANFMCIGAQKAGTTWLYLQLEKRPDVWLPYIKEIHYYDSPRAPRFFLLFHPSGFVRRYLRQEIRRAIQDESHRKWYARYYLLPRNDPWYRSLFQPELGQLAGEVAPDYATLPDSMIRRIKQSFPDLRIVYLLRDPLDRAWSQAAMVFGRFGQKGVWPDMESEIQGFLLDPRQLAHSRYLHNIKRWSSHFTPEQLFIGYFDQLRESPDLLMQSVLQFLHLPAQLPSEGMLAANPNPGSYPPMPEHMGRILAGQLLEEMEGLHDLLDNSYTARWLSRMNRLVR